MVILSKALKSICLYNLSCSKSPFSSKKITGFSWGPVFFCTSKKAGRLTPASLTNNNPPRTASDGLVETGNFHHEVQPQTTCKQSQTIPHFFVEPNSVILPSSIFFSHLQKKKRKRKPKKKCWCSTVFVEAWDNSPPNLRWLRAARS